MTTFQVQSWFHGRQQSDPLKDASSPNSPEKFSVAPEAPLNKACKSSPAYKGNWIVDVLLVIRDSMILFLGIKTFLYLTTPIFFFEPLRGFEKLSGQISVPGLIEQVKLKECRVIYYGL